MAKIQSLSESQQQLIFKDAERLSADTNLNIELIKNALLRFAIPLSDGRVYYSPDPAKMLAHIPPKDLPQVFQLGLDLLRHLEGLTHVQELDFYYTNGESRLFIAKLMKHLQDNRQSLIQIGLPLTRFNGPNHLEYYLGFNLVTRMPYRIEYSTSRSGVKTCTYLWRSKNGETVKYEDASPVNGCAISFDLEIEKIREPLFEFKLAVLNEVEDALLHRDPDTLIDSVVALKERYLDEDQRKKIRSLKAIHDAQENFNSYCNDIDEEYEVMPITMGDISSAELFVANMADTIDNGYPHKLRMALGALMSLGSDFKPKLSLPSPYAAWGTQDWDTLVDFALLTAKVRSRPSRKWDFNRLLEKEAPRMREDSVSDNEREAFLLKRAPQTKDHANTQPNAFHREGEYWAIRFNSRQPSLKFSDVKGFHYIAILLSYPNREYSVSDLWNLVGKSLTPDQLTFSTAHKKDLSNDWNRAEPLDGEIHQELVDDKTRKEVLEELAAAEAEMKTNPSLELKEKAEKLRQYCSSSITPVGRSRKFVTNPEKQRKAITNNISRALRKLQECDESLWQHLYRSIKTGSICKYCPEKEIVWSVKI